MALTCKACISPSSFLFAMESEALFAVSSLSCSRASASSASAERRALSDYINEDRIF